MDERHARGTFGKELLDAVAAGMDSEAELPSSDGEELDRHLRPAVTLVSAWVSEVARKERMDTSLLATRADLVALLRGDASARLRSRAGAPSSSATTSSASSTGAPGWPSTGAVGCG